MRRSDKAHWLRLLAGYGLAIAAPLLAFFGRLWLGDDLGGFVPFIFFFPAIVLAGAIGGLWPALVATLWSAALSTYFIEPMGQFSVQGRAGWLRLAIFFIDGLLMSAILEWVHRLRRRASRQAETVRRSEARFRRLAESGVFGVALGDLDGRFTYANDAFLRIIGFERDEVLAGKARWDAITPAEHRAADARATERLRVGGVAEPYEKEYIRKDGTRVPVLVGSAAIEEGGEGGPTFIGFYLDLTERKKVEATLQQQNQKLRASLEQIEIAEEEMRLQNEELASAREQVEAERQKYHELFDFAPDGYLVTDMWGVIREANQAAAKLLGSSSQDLITKPLVNFVTPESRQSFFAHIEKLCDDPRDPTVHEWEIRIQPPGAAVFNAALRVVAVCDEGKKPTSVRWMVRDITEAKRYADALRESEERFRTMADSAPVLIWLAGPDRRFTWLNKGWLEFTGRPMPEQVGEGWVASVHPDDAQRCLATFGESFTKRWPFQMDFRLRRFDGQYRWVTGQGMPLFRGGEFVGYIGSTIDVHDRRAAEEAAQAREAEMRLITDSLPVLISRIGRDMRYEFVNKAYETWFGVKREEIVGRHMSEVLGRDAFERVRPHAERVVGGESVQYETVLPYDVGPRLVNVLYVPRRDGAGEVIGYFAMVQDVTEQRRGEEAESRLAAIVASSSDAIIGKDIEGFITTWNDAARHMYGYTAEEAIGRHVTILIPEPLRAQEDEILARIRGGERVPPFETRRVAKDGRMLDVAITVSPIKDAAGNVIGASKIARDITAQKRTERALRDSEERLRLAMEAGRIGVWDWDILADRVSWSPLVYEFHGLKPGEFGGRVQDFANILHPEDRDRVGAEIRAALEGVSPYETETRIVRPTGEVRWIATKAMVLRDAEGRPLRMLGATIDITERRMAEAALKALNETLEQRVEQRTAELRQHQQRLRLLASELTRAEQRERRRVATSLHDDLAQMLAIGKMKLSLIQNPPPESRKVLDELSGYLDQAIKYTRTLMSELSPSMLYEFGLDEALEWLAEKMQTHGLEVRVEHDDQPKPLSDDIRAVVFTSVREMFFNVIKHAQTDRASVHATRDGDRVVVRVEDGGKGFDPSNLAAVSPSDPTAGGFGLFNIRERVDVLGGSMVIHSTPGGGTRITLSVPIGEASAERGPRQ